MDTLTFNDTTKTITVAGTTALSGLTTDVTISSATNNQALIYVSGNSKWQNTTLTSSSIRRNRRKMEKCNIKCSHCVI